MKLKQALLTYRLKNNFSQKMMAKHLGVSFRAYQYWEAGTVRPTGTSLLKISDKLSLKKVEL